MFIVRIGNRQGPQCFFKHPNDRGGIYIGPVEWILILQTIFYNKESGLGAKYSLRIRKQLAKARSNSRRRHVMSKNNKKFGMLLKLFNNRVLGLVKTR